ncbi:MAG: DUF4040 domain-containing protein [Clostridia bacterium]|nr:DUF4040 domain-containing protein [Clostridia bacterium]
MQILMILLLAAVLICALCVAFTKNLLAAAVVFMTQSLALSVVWLLLESPDLGITEAAVGAGVDSLLLFATLKRIRAIDSDARENRKREEEQDGTRS